MCKGHKIHNIKINIKIPCNIWYKVNFGLHPFASVTIFQLSASRKASQSARMNI